MDDQLASLLASACSRSAVTPQAFFALREHFPGYKLIRREAWEEEPGCARPQRPFAALKRPSRPPLFLPVQAVLWPAE